MGINYTPVNRNNLEEAIEVAVVVFGEEDRESITDEFNAAVHPGAHGPAPRIGRQHYFLATEKGRPVGITGYYSIEGHQEDAWLGWMGVLETHKRRGIGRQLVLEAFARAAEEKPRNLRIWTGQEPVDADARRLYTDMGFAEEPYKPGATGAAGRISVFSKSAYPADGGSPSWHHAAYPVDCEDYYIPYLDEKLKGQHP